MDFVRQPHSQPLIDCYRCVADGVTFVISGALCGDAGYFRFGDGVICYGQCAVGGTSSSADGPMFDALNHVSVDGRQVCLPFDPGQVINNLQAERYLGGAAEGMGFYGRRLVRSSYYMLRPLMSVALRKHLQKLYFHGWQNIPFPAWPVDSTVEQIHERLLTLALQAGNGKPIPFIWFWPDGAPSCTILTHDVETSVGLKRRGELMDLNDSFAIKTSFQLVPEGRYTVSGAVLNDIRSRGFEVNVHDLNHDGHLFQEKTEFLRRAGKINGYLRSFGASGFRAAIMYRNIDWLRALNVMYDMSVPNVSHLDPQRGGCCTVRPFFIGNNIVELPVTMTQDYTLFHILGRYSTDIWLEQSRRIRRRNGLLSAIVHPDYLDSPRALEVYKGLLAHFSELRSTGQTWIALPKDVAAWWRQRSLLSLVPSGTGWRIEGEGSHRACLAYAVLDGESLRYELDRSGTA
jgi:hypothetical protein